MNHISRSILLLVICTSAIASAQTEKVDIVRYTDNFYKLVCTNGENSANTLAFTGKDGILLIDAGYTQTAELLQSRIAGLGNGDLKILITTHVHNDHIGANDLLSKKGISLIAHKNVRSRLEGYYGQYIDLPDDALPTITFEKDLTVYFNDEQINLHYLPGHSDGDVVVHFPEAKMVFMGDLLITSGFPSVETSVGGSIEQYLETMGKVLEIFPEDTRFIGGHGEDYRYDEMTQYFEMATNTTDAIRLGLQRGKDIDTLRNEEILQPWESIVGSGPDSNYWIGAVATSLMNPVPRPSIAEPLLETLIRADAIAAISQYKALKRSNTQEYGFQENALNVLGYYLLDRERVGEAIDIFKLNIEEYPEAFNVYDSLGEAYMGNGDNALAMQNYERSLTLNPNNTNAVEMLKKLSSKVKAD